MRSNNSTEYVSEVLAYSRFIVHEQMFQLFNYGALRLPSVSIVAFVRVSAKA